jgi:protocatechuate 3,4-dioxygenase beta subunit
LLQWEIGLQFAYWIKEATMSSAFRALMFVALAPLALCQTTPPPPAPTGSVEGIVIRADTREPLKKAWVTVRMVEGPGKSSGVLTDATGRFELTDIEPGRYRLRVERNGYVSQAYGQQGPRMPGTILSISPGQTVRDIQVAMIASGVLSGHIYDDDAEPVVNAQVSVLSFRYREGRRELLPMWGGPTNDLGEFRIYGLAPGSYYVSATFRGRGRPPLAGGSSAAGGAGSGEEMGYAPTYYPGTNDIGRAIPLDLKSGDKVPGLDFNLLSTRAVRVRGRILNPATGKGESRVMVMIVPRESKVRSFSPSTQAYVNNPQGEFELRGVVPGSYTLIANSSAGDETYQARIPLEVGPTDIDGLIVPLGKGAEIAGRVRWESGSELNSDRTIHVGLTAREFGFEMWRRVPDVKKGGSFVLKNVVDGEYRVGIYGAPEDCYLQSARLGGDDVLTNGVSISVGRTPGPLEIAINCAGAILEGSVADEEFKPVTGANVVLVPDTERREMPHLFKTTTTDQYGGFSIRGIAPGEYKAFAWERIERGAYQDPEFLRRFEGDGKTVTVKEGERLVVQLPLIPAEGK